MRRTAGLPWAPLLLAAGAFGGAGRGEARQSPRTVRGFRFAMDADSELACAGRGGASDRGGEAA